MASNYNSRYKPAEVLWMNGKGHLIRAHETFEDLLKSNPSCYQSCSVIFKHKKSCVFKHSFLYLHYSLLFPLEHEPQSHLEMKF
jgi:hypothetical protein